MKTTEEEPSVNDKVNDVLNKSSSHYKANTPQDEINNTKTGIKVKTGQILNYPLPYQEEKARRKLELENSRKQNKIRENVNDYSR